MKPKVLNKYRDHISDDVYIGRPSKWGNPFGIAAETFRPFGPLYRSQTEFTDREQAIFHYRLYLDANPHLKLLAQQELKGKNLVCFCAPQRCHGDILLKIANEKTELKGFESCLLKT